jgi:hypothetical protein
MHEGDGMTRVGVHAVVLLLLANSGIAQAAPSRAVGSLTTALRTLEKTADALEALADDTPAAQLGRITREERAAWLTLIDAFRAFEAALDEPQPMDRAIAGGLIEELEIAWSALRDFARARAARHPVGMRDAAQSLRAAARDAIEILDGRRPPPAPRV